MTTPGTWASADAMTAAKLNTELRDQFLRLYGPPRVHAYKDPALPQSLVSSATLSLVTLTLTTYDSAAMLQSGNRLVVPIAGLYHVTTLLELDESVNSNLGARTLNVRRNSVNSPTGGTSVITVDKGMGTMSAYAFVNNPTTILASKLIPCNANDHLQLFVNQTSTTTKSVPGGKQKTFLEAIWRGVLPAGTP